MGDEKNRGHRLHWMQACAILGCGRRKFYALVQSGVLPAYKVAGMKRGLWVWKGDCQALIRQLIAKDCAE